MKCQVLASNVAQVSLSDDTEVLFSYQTAVAIFIPGRGWVRDGHFYSKTTSRHINAYADRDAAMVTHEEFLRLLRPITHEAAPDTVTQMASILERLTVWFGNPDTYGGDLADLAQEAKDLFAEHPELPTVY